MIGCFKSDVAVHLHKIRLLDSHVWKSQIKSGRFRLSVMVMMLVLCGNVILIIACLHITFLSGYVVHKFKYSITYSINDISSWPSVNPPRLSLEKHKRVYC